VIELSAVCDKSAVLAQITAERYGAHRALTDATRALEDMRPDVVHVLTPPHTHPALVSQSLAAGAHVVCEKPLAPSAVETRALLAAAADVGRVLVETRNLLYNDVVLEFDRAIASGAVGDIREVETALSLSLGTADVPSQGLGLPGGIAHDYLPHLAYLLLHFAAPRRGVDTVVGTVDNLSGRPDLKFDHVDVLMNIGDVRGRIRVSPDVLPGSLRVIVRGTGGTLEADLYQPYLRRQGPPWDGKLAPFGQLIDGVKLFAAGGRNIRDRLLQHGTYHGMGPMLSDVYGSLAKAGPVPIAAEDLLASAELIDRVVELGARQ
jgi:predicted dehydrogenase